jgi:hypothetical protein
MTGQTRPSSHTIAPTMRGAIRRPNKRMQLTKLRAAPERQDKVPPCAPAGDMDGGTASQLIRGVRRTRRGEVVLRITAAIAIGLTLSSAGAEPLDPDLHRLVTSCAPESLGSFRLPEQSDLVGDWHLHPGSYKARADFDGDTSEDVAIMMVRRDGPGFRLLVVFSPDSQAPRAVVVEDAAWVAQGFGLAIAKPGRYKTAAGKGYDLGPGNTDPPELQLELPAIERFHFESWSAFWYWSKAENRFKYIQMSD